MKLRSLLLNNTSHKLRALFFGLAATLANTASALTTGDIAFVGFNADGNDNLAFVALTDIASGEAITFEDNEWNGTTWADAAESAFIWTSNATVAAGTVVLLNDVSTTPTASTGTIEFGLAATYGSGRGIGASDEIVYAYQGARTSPVFITAVTNGTGGFAGANGILTGTGLTSGTNALDLNVRDEDGDIYAWIGTRAGYADFAAVRAAINAAPTAGNWNFQDGTGDQGIDGTQPDVPFSTTAFSTGSVIALSVSATATSFSESAANPASTGTVTRATSGAADLTVTLSSSDTTEATVPATVTILANQTTATFDVTAVNDTFPDGSKSTIITASALGATNGTLTLTVTDDGDVLDTSFMLTEIQSSQSATKPTTATDYWELTNISGSAKDISGYSWHDNGRSGAAAQAYKLPESTSIAAGESVIFTATPVADFRAWWGIASSVQVFQSVGAPGLGSSDGVSFFDAGQNELFFFNYAANGFTKEDGNASTGLHAGPSAGGSADSQALIWEPSSGTATPRYTFASGTNYGSVAAVSPATDTGSPGVTVGNPTLAIANASIVEGNSGTTTLALTVTRSNITTAFTVDYAVTGGTATSGTDYVSLANGTLTFTASGSATQSIDVTVNGDTNTESDETIIVTLSNVVNTTGTTVIGTASGTGTITNDDTIAPLFTTQPSSTTIATGYTATLSLVATGTPAPTIQWYQGSTGTTTTPVGTNSSSFTTPALTTTTDYWARVTNGGGSVDSNTVTVTVTTGVAAVDLSNYIRVARINLPEYRRTALPAGTPVSNLLCDEASGVTYNWDTDTLFICGDGGRAITQVTKSGQLVDTMTLDLNAAKPQGTEFYDPEGITYIGSGQFVFSEERERQLVKFTYVGGTTLTRAAAQTVDLGTFDDNTGTEGMSWDPQTSGFIVLKEKTPIGVFQTGIDWNAGTATNGSPTTVNSTNLFDTTLLGMTDVADVFAFSNIPSMTGQSQASNLLILGQENARVLNVNRSTGAILSTLNINSDAGNPLSAADQQPEGITMDRAGNIYIVNENGGGSIEYPQLWVYAPSTLPNAAPTSVALNNSVNSLQENTSTASPTKLGDIVVTDDGLGTNTLSVSGTDAASFQITGNALYLKSGVVLDFETKTSYDVTINADDATLGTTPDVTVNYTLTVTDQVVETPIPPALIITEVAPWASSNGAVGGDWFEVTNISANAVDITGWKVDDSSNAYATSLALTGITSIAAGESVIFIESTVTNQATIVDTFKTVWFGGSTPAGLQVGTYQGGSIGLSTGGDAVNLFTAGGARHSGVSFGAADAVSPFQSFDNTAAANDVAISLLSTTGVNGAFVAATSAVEIGSPGFSAPGVLRVTEVAPWSSTAANSPVAADWFEVTNIGARAVDITGWKVDDSSESPAAALALTGITSIAPGESVIFIETATLSTTKATFLSNWFGASPPATLQIGAYTGGGIGLSTAGDAVNLYDTNNVRQANVSFALSPSAAPFTTFDNSAAANVSAITQFSAVGVNSAFVAANSSNEVGSPGLRNQPPVLANNIPNQSTSRGTAFSYVVPLNTFADPESQPLTYSATLSDNSPLPAWLSFTAATRTLAGTPTAVDLGNVVVKVSATDGGLASSTNFTIQVAPAFGSAYFPQSVASGDPRSSSVVLWSRLLDGNTSVNRSVTLHMSTTGTIADVGTTAALGGTNVWTGGALTAQSAHDGVVKVKVGSLAADTTYYYQFTYSDQRSPIGRTKTAPAAGSTRTVKYAAINCNDFVGRYFNVLRQLSEREQNSIDFVLNLGDYVYETTGDPSFQTSLPERAMVFSNPAEAINLGSGNYAAQSVGNYRDIYKTIRQDVQLQRVHELFPMISIWDDHEFSDDNWKDNATYFDDKVSEQQTNRKKNGEQAWMEFLPTERGMAGTGNGLEIDSADLYPNTVIYDAFNFGTNLDLILTDIRTNRADHLIPENAIPSGIPMTETNVIATLAAVNGLDVPTFTAAVWPSIRSNFAQYVNIDDSAYAAVKGVYKAIMAASVNNALAALPVGQTPSTTGAAYADAQVVGFHDANFINQAFLAAGQSAPFDTAALDAMPRGLSYYLLGKTSVFSDYGSRYQVVNPTFQLFAGYTYQAFVLSSGALGRDQAFYNTAQQTFLATALANSTAAGNKWRVVASSTPYTPIKLELGDLPAGLTLPTQGTISGVNIPASLPSQFLVEFLLNADEPAGFPQFRQGMIDLFAQHDAIIVSGDIHAELIGKNNATNGQKVVDFTVPSASSSEFRRAVSGAFATVEGLMTPGVQAATGLSGPFAFDSASKQAVINATDAIIKHNTPEMFQADTAAHGYTVFTAGASAFNADYQKINVSEIGNNHYALSSAALDALFQKESFTVTKTGSGASSDLNLGVPQNDTTLVIGDASMNEGNSGTSTLNFTVTRSDLLGSFTVDFATSSGTATAGSDYAAASGTLTFTAGGSTTQNISVLLTGDTTIESNETLIVTLSNVVNTAGTATITDATGTGTITNDDTVPNSFPSNGKITSTLKGFIDLDAAPLASTNGAEIPAFDPLSKRAFTSSNSGIQVINLTNPAAPVFINTIAPASLGVAGLTSNDVSSVTVRKGTGGNPSVLAAAIISSPKSALGYVIFINPATGALIGSSQVGANPDHIAFSPDGTKLLVANEGELDAVNGVPADVVTNDTTVGSVSIISVPAAITGVPTSLITATADFTAYDSQSAALSAAGVRIFQGGKPSTDFEPEYFAISADSTKALVTLQEANAVATLDLATATFTSVVPLGKKNFATGRHDFSDRDGLTAAGAATTLVNPTTGSPVFGLYMPDAVASYSAAGQTYYITANEGDDRNDFFNPDETTTVGAATGYTLDPTVFPNATALKNQASLGRLTVCNSPGLRGDNDGDGDVDEILSYGGRSFSILDSTGAIIWDSGDMIENIIASQFPANFDDTRSDNKGPEPEGVTIATIGSRTYAFIGLERSHMTLMFDVTNPAAVTFAGGLVRSGDLNPEGLVVVSAADSPTGKPLLLQASEVSQTLTIHELNQTTDYTLQVLHYYGESGLLGIQTAPIMGAMIDKFDDQYANTLVLAEGDSFIPGPWLVAGADPSLSAVAGIGATALGRPDFAIMNAFGTDASALGNHEFDLGSPVLSGAFFPSAPWVGAQFPFITTNLNFAGDSSLKARADTTLGGTGGAIAGLETTAIKAKIAPYAVQTISGQKVGIVGATTWDLLSKTSANGTVPKDDANADTSDLQEVAAYLQGAITALQGLGVNKIILVDQLDTLQRNKDLAGLVSGIDIMVAGGGHERMGDANDVAVGFNGHDADFIADAYPIVTTAADGKPTLIVTTDTEFSYLGRLVADFDADGVLILPNLNTVINGAYASTEANLQTAYATANPASTIIAGSTIGTAVQSITNALNTIVVAKDSSVFGYTDVYLEGDRVFGRTQEVNQGNITTDANAWKARTALGLGTADAVFSLKNGGGIRASLGSVLANGSKIAPLANPITGKPAKGVSLLDIENSLRFDNKLMVFDTTPSGLLTILNFLAGVSSGPTSQSGGYPQVGNIRFSYNSALPAGQKVRSAALVNEAGHITARIVENGAVLTGAPTTIKCVALNFNAQGGDGYPIKANADNFRYILTNGTLSAAIDETLDFTAAANVPANVLGEQKAFSDFLVARHPSLATAYNVADTPVAQDTRIQQIAYRSDTVLSGPATFAAWLAQNGFNGTAGGDTDNDGVPDSLEYFFNSSPNSAVDRDNLPTVTMNGSDLEFRFTYLNSTVFNGFFQCSEDLINWANATPGVDYELISETVSGAETSVRFRIFCNPLATTQGPFTYMTPFTTEVERGAIDQLTITNHGMVGAGRVTGEALDSFGETMGAASGLSITGWSYNSGTGKFNGTFNVLPDRGYNSGSIFSNYAARVHELPFTFTPYYGAGPVTQTQIVPAYSSTTKFTYVDGAKTKFTTGLNAVAVNTIMGQSVGTAPAANGPGGATENLISFDAEAIHVFADGSGFVSDEYGAYIARFNSAKQFTKLIQLPAAAQPHRAVGTLNYDAVTTPTNGRRNNQGLEGLSVSPDNSRLFALMQSALVQDGGAAQTRFNTRLFVYDIAGAKIENPVLIGEYAVQLPRYDLNGNNSALDATAAQSEIVALSNTQFLMLPRDGNGLGKGSTDPIVTKTVDLVDFATATNVLGTYDAEGNQISPSGALRTTITPARSTVVVNLLSSVDLTKFGFNTNTTSPNSFTVNEKAEGMALVPDTSTASTEDYFLFVGNDNDFQSSDVKMLNAAGTFITPQIDARDRGITNDAVFTAWRITICPNNRKFFKINVPDAP